MKIEEGQYIYTIKSKFSYLDDYHGDDILIKPMIVEFTVVLEKISKVDLEFWFDSIFSNKLLLHAKYNTVDDPIQVLKPYYSDFLYVESTSLDYILNLILTILQSNSSMQDNKIKSLSYQIL